MITLKMETAKFNRDLKNFIKKSDLATEIIIKEVAFDLLADILQPPPKGRHPVDTGRARAAWYPSIVGLGMNFDLGSGSGVEKGKKEGKFIDKTKGRYLKYVDMINSVHYIMFLEYGGSKEQAPAGMVRISMRKRRNKMPKELSDEFLKEWNKFNF